MIEDKKNCESLFRKFWTLELKTRSGVQFKRPGQSYKVLDSRYTNEYLKLKNELSDCLEFLSRDDLLKIYTDRVLGLKAREILRKRREEK